MLVSDLNIFLCFGGMIIKDMRSGVLFIIVLMTIFSFNCTTPKDMSTVKIHTIRMKPGEDVMLFLKDYIDRNKISAAFVMSAVGSLTRFHLRFANKESGTVSEGHFEVVSLTGLLSTAGMHLHMSVSESTGHTIGGHLLEGNFVYTTLEVVLGETNDMFYSRETDPTYGYKELVVKPLKP